MNEEIKAVQQLTTLLKSFEQTQKDFLACIKLIGNMVRDNGVQLDRIEGKIDEQRRK